MENSSNQAAVPEKESARPSACSAECIEPPAQSGAPEGCWFDVAAADAACAFFPSYLRHTEAEWAGKPFELAPWQRDIVRRVFGWKKADGTRLIQTLYVEIPRKNGKTEFAAGLALLLLLGDGEPGGQGYAMAADKDQAKIAFKKAHTMVHLSAGLTKHIEPLTTSLYCPELMASFKPISSAPNTKHGFSPSFAIADEIHAWPEGELAEVIAEGMGARRQPLEVYITTAGIKGVGYGWTMHERALRIRDGKIVDPTFLPVIFAADEKDDWKDEATWAKANPGFGVSPKVGYLRRKFAEAQESPRLQNRFKRYSLDLWTEQITRWLDIEDWDACAPPELPNWQALEQVLRGRDSYSAVDLSSKIDLTALAHVFPPQEKGGDWHALWRLFMPEANVEKAEKRDKLPYKAWIAMGALKTTPGNVVDFAFVKQQLMDDAALFHIVECAYDPWNALQFATEMMGEGMTMVEFRQGWSMSEPSKSFEALVVSHKLRHGGQPVLREMAKAVSIVTDPKSNIRPDKSERSLKIDGITAVIMGHGRGSVAAKKFVSVYETRGIESIEIG